MKAARPAVQLCSPYQSVNIAPSLAMRSMFGRSVAHHAVVVGTDVEPADVVGHDHQDVRLAAGACWWALRCGLRLLCRGLS